MAALTKQILLERIGNELELPKSASKKVLEDVLEIIKGSLEQGEDVLVSGFGKFCVRDKAERKGRNPVKRIIKSIRPIELFEHKKKSVDIETILKTGNEIQQIGARQ